MSSKENGRNQRPGAKRSDWRLARFLGANLALGAVSGWIFVAGLLYFDIGGLGALVRESSIGPLAVVMLLAVMTITWGSAAMGTAVFLMRWNRDDDSAGKRAPIFAPLRALAPARIKSR